MASIDKRVAADGTVSYRVRVRIRGQTRTATFERRTDAASPERVRAAVNAAGSRRGLALNSKKCYGAWAARYAAFGDDERALMQMILREVGRLNELITQFLDYSKPRSLRLRSVPATR